MPRLRHEIMADGSRLFAEFGQTVLWYDVRDHVETLRRAKLTAFVCDDVTTAWIDFSYRGHAFSINDQLGDYWFFVTDPKCPDRILNKVVSHFAKILPMTGP